MSTLLTRAQPRLTLAVCLGAASFGVVSSALAECTGPPALEVQLHARPDVDTYAALGNWFGDNRNPDCAVEAFRSALKLEPDSARLAYLLGLSFYTSGRTQEAVAPLQQSVQLDPGEDKPHLLLAAALSNLDRNKEAIPEWIAAIKLDPTSKMALDGLAKAYISVGDYETVITHLASAPRDENLTLDLAMAYGKAANFESAAQVLAEGLKTYPNSDNLTNALLTVDVKLLRYQEASALAETLVRRNPDDIGAQRTYLGILVLNGDMDLAAPLARKLLALAPHDPDVLYMSGVLDRNAGDFSAARKHLEEAVALNPTHSDSHYNLGMVLAQLQDEAGAKAQFEKSIELGATEPEIRLELSKVLRALGETQEAQDQFNQYLRGLRDKAAHTLAIEKSSQALQALKAGDNRKAADLYRDASAAMPESAGLAYKLALVLQDLGDKQGERAALEQAIKANPRFIDAQYQLGYVESGDGDYSAAERQFRLVLKAMPESTEAWVALAATLAMESRFPEAQDAVNTALKLDPNNAEAAQLNINLAANLNAR